MTPRLRVPPWPGTPVLLAVAGAAALGLAVAGWFAPAVVLRGWLVGFVAVGGVAFGSIACLAIHGLTGGRWGDVAAPSFRAGALALPILLPLGLPLVLGASRLYAWAADPAAAGPGVAALLLNAGSVGLRSALLIAALSTFAVLAWRGPLSRLAAGLCLVVYAVGMDVAAVDWILSLDPRFTSSAFGAQVIIQQIASAYAVAILASDAPADDDVWGDLGALLLAAVLGESYLVLMTFIIEWYGDLPNQAAYYLARSRHGWRWLLVAATVTGAVGPILGLMASRIRRSPGALRLVAVAVLLGLVAEDIWLVAPSAGPLAGSGGWAALAACIAVAALASLWLVAVRRAAGTFDTAPPERLHGG